MMSPAPSNASMASNETDLEQLHADACGTTQIEKVSLISFIFFVSFVDSWSLIFSKDSATYSGEVRGRATYCLMSERLSKPLLLRWKGWTMLLTI